MSVVAAEIALGDVGVVSDTLVVAASVDLSDGGTVGDGIDGIRVFAEGGIAADTITIAALLTMLDSGGGSDGATTDAGTRALADRGRCADDLWKVPPKAVRFTAPVMATCDVSVDVVLVGSTTVQATPVSAVTARVSAG